MPAELFKVIANFQDSNGNPLSGSGYTVRLFDKDRWFNDRLDARPLSKDGVAEFLIAVADVFSVDSPGERTPDLYFVVEKEGREIFRSEVFPNVDFDRIDPTTGRPRTLTMEFGPFRIPG